MKRPPFSTATSWGAGAAAVWPRGCPASAASPLRAGAVLGRVPHRRITTMPALPCRGSVKALPNGGPPWLGHVHPTGLPLPVRVCAADRRAGHL